MRALLLLIFGLGGLLAAAVTVAAIGWTFGGALSIHGWIALALGVSASFGLGVGLMSLAFFSARRGFDDVHRPNDQAEL